VFSNVETAYIVSKYQHRFHGICLILHRLWHMCRHFLHRLVQEHHTLPEHYTTCFMHNNIMRLEATLDATCVIMQMQLNFLHGLVQKHHQHICEVGAGA